MVDLGVYNFVKHALAAGKSKEEIVADLTRGGMLTQQMIEETIGAVEKGAVPSPMSAEAALGASESANMSFQERSVPPGKSAAVTASTVGLVSPQLQHGATPGGMPLVERRHKERGVGLLLSLIILVAVAAGVWKYGQPQLSKYQAMFQDIRQQYQSNGIDPFHVGTARQ